MRGFASDFSGADGDVIFGELMPLSQLQPAAIVSPVLILVLCAVAAVGTILLLPSRREIAMRRIGAIILTLAGVIFGALLLRLTAGSVSKDGVGPYFWIFSAIAIASAVRVITHPRPVYSALYFILTVFASAGLFVLCAAEFMAVALVMIYAGAILVTYVFVIMLASEATASSTTLSGLADHDAESREPIVASVVGFALMGVLLFVIFDRATNFGNPARPDGLTVQGASDADYIARAMAHNTATPVDPTQATPAALTPVATPMPAALLSGQTQQLGVYLFSNQLVNLEIAGLMLAIGMVGAIVISRRRVIEKDEGWEPTTETIVGPATPIDDNPHSIPVYGTDNPRQKAYPET